ncbi:ABC transporter substrate-binding protein [Pseudodesulfovibrio sediminis]|nr:ABC transporter substrate-binding protein [Pseudodesulfovibrio sediminis]
MKKLILTLVLVCLLVGAAAAQEQDAQTPKARIQEGMDNLIAMLSDPKMQEPEHHDEAIAELRKVAEQFIDFGLVTKFAVGRPWLDMSPQMRTDLTNAFVRLLERSYLKRIPAYEGQRIEYKNEVVSGKKAKVLTEIFDKDKKIIVEFRLRIVDGRWMIYDVVAEGVSLVMNYRSQFSAVLDSGTPEDLLRLINEKVEKIDEVQKSEGQ